MEGAAWRPFRARQFNKKRKNMAAKINLRIAEPCHENWNNMTSSEKGRFCGSCQKQVVDFTAMTDAQLVAFFDKPSTGSVCGRFMNTQLEREVKAPPKQIPWARYVFQFAFPAFVASLKANAQDVKMGKIAVTPVQVQPSGNCQTTTPSTTMGDTTFHPIGVTLGIVAPPVRVATELIKGRVVDEQNNPISNASVITGPRTGVITDANGYFQYHPLRGWKEITLTITAIGYGEQTLTVRPTDDISHLQVIMMHSFTAILGEVVVTKSTAIATAPVTGTVVNEKGEPVPFAFLEIPGVTTTTNKDGRFFLSSAKRWKKLNIAVTAEGYQPQQVALKSNDKLDDIVIHLNSTAKKLQQEEIARHNQPWSWKLYPNPVQRGGQLGITINSVAAGDCKLWITDIAGNRVSEKKVSLAKGQNTVSIETSENWKAGVYVLQLLTAGDFTCLSEKFVIR